MKSLSALEQNTLDQQAAARPRRTLNRRGPSPLALEPRVMFDGATADAAVAAAKAASVAADASAHVSADAPADAAAVRAAGAGAFHVAAAVLPSAAPAAARHEIVFVEDNLPDYRTLVAGVKAGVEVVVLDHTKDGLQQMIGALDGHAPVDAIHLVTHGAEGQIELGASVLDGASLELHADALARLGSRLNAGGDLLVYGCDVAAGEGGSAFVERLAQLTGADVAASTDLTGSSAYGNWTLEAHRGQVETEAMALDGVGWTGELDTVTVYNANWQTLVFDGKTTIVGTGKANGDVVRFNSVITVDGQTIDAVVTTAISGTSITDYDSTANPSNKTAYFQPSLQTSANGGNATFTIAFFKAGTYTGAGTGIAVTLQNVVVNSYDIDASSTGAADRQFQSFQGFARYELANSTYLVPTVNGDGSVTFLYTTANAVNNGSIYADGYRVRVYYDSMSTFKVNAGVRGSNSATAYFSFDFSVGPAWSGATTVTGSPAPNLGYSTTTFAEAAANDGSIGATATITLANGSFAGADGQELAGVGFTGVPAGLSAHVTRVDATHATLSFSGKADAHANANDVRNLGVSFGNAAFASGNADAVTGAARADLVIDFADPPADTTAPVVAPGQHFSYAENRAASAGAIGFATAADDRGVTGFRFAAGGATSADGYFQLAADGAISLTDAGRAAGAPSNDYETIPNSFTYAVQARDAAGNWSAGVDVRLDVTNVDDLAPVFGSGAGAPVAEHQNLLYTAAAADLVDFTDGLVTYSLKAGAGDAALLTIDAASGAVRLAGGNLDFETKAAYSFTVIASDASGNAREQAVSVTVLEADESAPTVAIRSDKPVLKAGDSATLTFTFSEDVGASFTADDIRTATGTIDAFTRVDATHYTARYTPAAGIPGGAFDVGVDSGRFTDLAGNDNTAPARVTLVVDTVAPQIAGPGDAGGAASTISVPEGTLAVHTFAADEGVSWSLAGGEDAARFTITAGGALSFRSAPDFGAPQDGPADGANTYLVAVRATDSAGNAATQLVEVTVTDVNAAPTAAPDAIVTLEDTAKTGRLPAAADIDGDLVTYARAGDPAHGTVAIAPDGSYTYTPAADYHGADSFGYSVSDGRGGSNTYVVNVMVTPANDAPVAADTAIATLEDTVKSGMLPLAADVDGDVVTYAKAGDPAHGTVTVAADGSYVYTPDADYHGKDGFSYRVGDGHGAGNTYRVDIDVTPVNDAPAAADTAIRATEDQPASGALPAAVDIDGDAVAYAKAGDPAHGSVAIAPDGGYTYTPDAGYHGRDSFRYSVDDGQGGVRTYTVEVTVDAINHAPHGAAGTVATREDTPVSGRLPAAVDPDGDALHYTAADAPRHGSVVIGADGRFTYTPQADWHGADRFGYTVGDGKGGSATYTMDVTVEAVNDAPLAHGGASAKGTVGEPLDAVTVPAFTDADGDAIGYSATLADGAPLPSWLAFDPATRSFTGTPPQGSAGSYTVLVRGSDGEAAATAAVTLAVADPAAPAQALAIVSMTRDSGASATDFITADGAAGRTVDGTIDAPLGRNEAVQVSFDGGATWRTAVASGSAWSAVDDGAHASNWTIAARVVNTAAGLNGAAVAREVVLDTTPPAAPTVDSLATASATPVLSGSAALGAGEILRVSVNGAIYEVVTADGAADASAPGAAWRLDLATAVPVSGRAAPLDGGRSYAVTASVTDLAGNVRSSAQAGTVSVKAPAQDTPVQDTPPQDAPPQDAPPLTAPVLAQLQAQPQSPTVAALPLQAQAAPLDAAAAAPVAEPAPLARIAGGYGDSRNGSDAAAPGSLVGGDTLQYGAGQGTRAAEQAQALNLRAAALSDVYTRDQGFRTVVARADEPALVVFQGVPDQFAETGSHVSLTVPADAFAHTQPKAVVRLSAVLQDGRPLPSWVQFNGQTGQFSGDAPRDFRGELKIKLIARDTGGREATALFRIHVGENRTAQRGAGMPAELAPAGKPGLSAQLRAGGRTLAGRG